MRLMLIMMDIAKSPIEMDAREIWNCILQNPEKQTAPLKSIGNTTGVHPQNQKLEPRTK